MTRQTVKLPAETVHVMDRDGDLEKIVCSELVVPTDDRGMPVVHRVETDQFNNLRVVENQHAFRLFHADVWAEVKVEERVAFEAVKNAS